MHRMRAVFVSTGSQEMGTNYRVLYLARSAKELGLDVHIILPGLARNRDWFPEGHYGNVPIHFTRCGVLGELIDKYTILRSLRPQFVHCFNVVRRCFPACLAYRMTNRSELIIDVDEHYSRIQLFGAAHRQYFKVCESITKRYADRLVVASRELEKWFGDPTRQHLLYLPNAVDLDYFNEQRSGWDTLKRQWGDKKVVMYFGALIPNYDADIVFDAAVQILARRNDLVFVFVGGGTMLESLRGRARQLNLQDKVQLLGFVPDELVPKYLCAADVFVFPIRDNWWNRMRCPGKVYHFIAAMAPIVTNPVGEVREALGECAWYFDDGDGKDFIRVLEECLDAGRNSRCATLPLVASHSWQARAESYVRFLADGRSLV